MRTPVKITTQSRLRLESQITGGLPSVRQRAYLKHPQSDHINFPSYLLSAKYAHEVSRNRPDLKLLVDRCDSTSSMASTFVAERLPFGMATVTAPPPPAFSFVTVLSQNFQRPQTLVLQCGTGVAPVWHPSVTPGVTPNSLTGELPSETAARLFVPLRFLQGQYLRAGG